MKKTNVLFIYFLTKIMLGLMVGDFFLAISVFHYIFTSYLLTHSDNSTISLLILIYLV